MESEVRRVNVTAGNMSSSRPLPLVNVMRGRLAERILTILLERGGYRVTRLGIEELFDEVKQLNIERYLGLGLPERLRTLPDLLVADAGVTWARLVEVKFRKCFNQATANELLATLTYQRRFWPESFMVIIRGQAIWSDARFHQDYIRVVPPEETWRLEGPRGTDIPDEEDAAADLMWQQLPMLTSLFHFRDFDSFGEQKEDRGRDFWASADFITEAIRDLARL